MDFKDSWSALVSIEPLINETLELRNRCSFFYRGEGRESSNISRNWSKGINYETEIIKKKDIVGIKEYLLGKFIKKENGMMLEGINGKEIEYKKCKFSCIVVKNNEKERGKIKLMAKE